MLSAFAPFEGQPSTLSRVASQVSSAVSRTTGQRTFAFDGQKLPKHRQDTTSGISRPCADTAYMAARIAHGICTVCGSVHSFGIVSGALTVVALQNQYSGVRLAQLSTAYCVSLSPLLPRAGSTIFCEHGWASQLETLSGESARMEFINWCAGNTKQRPRLCLVVLVVCRDDISDNEADGFCWTYHQHGGMVVRSFLLW